MEAAAPYERSATSSAEVPAVLGQTIHRKHIKGDLSFNFAGAILAVAERLDIALLRRAAWHAVRAHQALRLRFRHCPAKGWVAFDSGMFDANLPEVCCFARLVPPGSAPSRGRWIAAEAQRLASDIDPFSGMPLLRLVLFDCGGQGEDRLLLAVHHFVCDGLSCQILWRDVSRAYMALRDGRPIEDRPLGIELLEFSYFLRELARDDGALSYWLRPRPALVELDGCRWEEGFVGPWRRSTTARLTLDNAAAAGLRRTASEVHRCFLPELLLGAYVYVLGEWLGDGHVVVANWTSAHVTARGRYPVNGVVGNFAYPVFTYFVLDADRGFARTLEHARVEQLDAFEGALEFGACRFVEHTPGDDLAGGAIAVGALAMPLFTFNYMGNFPPRAGDMPLRWASEALETFVGAESEKYSLLDFDVDLQDDRMYLEVNYPEEHPLTPQLRAVAGRLLRFVGRLGYGVSAEG